MAIHNKSHSNHALMSLNKMRKDNSMKQKSAKDFKSPDKVKVLHCIMDCCDFLKDLPDESVQLSACPVETTLMLIGDKRSMPRCRREWNTPSLRRGTA